MPKSSVEKNEVGYMNTVVRNKEAKDYRGAGGVAWKVFWNLYSLGAAEHYMVYQTRSHIDFIPELAFVIEVDDVIEGVIFYTHSKTVAE